MERLRGMQAGRAWQSIPADDYDWTVTRAPERPWIHDYARTMTMKMFMAEPDGRGGSRVCITVEQAAEILRRVDALTLGAPKIVYVVGWQYCGHDDRYPAWHEGNPAIKRPGDADPLDSIRWLMEEGRRHHATVSVHVNMYDAYEDSPLWQAYLDNGLLNLEADGSLSKGGVWNGRQAYTVSYKREWDSGFAKKRIDELLALLPLEQAGTVHIDAFHCRADPGHGLSLRDSQAGRRQIIRYWRDRGIDVTSEFLYDEPVYEWMKPAPDQLVGLQPLAWHFSQKAWDYVERPAGLICGGAAGHRNKNGGELMGDVFGENITAEDLWTDFESRRGRPGWETAFLRDFCLKFLPFRFLNSRERLSFAARRGELSAAFSDGVATSSRGPALIRGGEVLRDGGDLLLPADWVSGGTFVSFSRDGGTRAWPVPAALRGAARVRVRPLTPDGPGRAVDEAVRDGRLTLSSKPGEAFVVDAG